MIVSVALAAIGLLCLQNQAFAGTISGTVKVTGAETSDHVVVYIEKTSGSFSLPAKRPALLHKNLAFFPRILPVLVGAIVDFPNEDPVFHSAFSVSPSNPFELGIYGQGNEKNLKFNNVGVVDVSCHVHPFMKATLLVLQNPYFVETDAKGKYTIRNVPAGRYTVKAHGLSGKPAARSTTVSGSGTSLLNFTIK